MGDKYLTLDRQKSRLLKAQRGKCKYCELTFKPDDKIEKHRLMPEAKGGKYIDNNLILLHLHCHDEIHTFTEVEYDKWVLERTLK
jgi:RNA-directed DNA polymerase